MNTSPNNNSQTHEEEILRGIFIPPELKHKIINNLKWKEKDDWLSKI